MGEQIDFKHSLGDKVRDTVTGYEGTVTGSYVFINGCKRYSVECPAKDEGGLPTDMTVDEDRLAAVEEPSAQVPKKETGGPRPGPSRTVPGPPSPPRPLAHRPVG